MVSQKIANLPNALVLYRFESYCQRLSDKDKVIYANEIKWQGGGIGRRSDAVGTRVECARYAYGKSRFSGSPDG